MMMALETEKLSLRINNRSIFDDVNLSLPRGAFASLLGRNGAGKSQLLRCLKGLRRPTSGKILVDGVETTEKERIRKIALVFQSAEMQIVSESVERDIAFGPVNLGLDKAEVEKRVEDAMSLMDLKEKAKERPGTLSGGELRKTAIAGVLAMKPDVIMLDEPFANLDYPSTLTVIKALVDLHEKGFTLLVVTHEAEKFLAHTDTLLVMKEGKLVENGPSGELYEKLPSYDIYLPRHVRFGELSWLNA